MTLLCVFLILLEKSHLLYFFVRSSSIHNKTFSSVIYEVFFLLFRVYRIAQRKRFSPLPFWTGFQYSFEFMGLRNRQRPSSLWISFWLFQYSFEFIGVRNKTRRNEYGYRNDVSILFEFMGLRNGRGFCKDSTSRVSFNTLSSLWGCATQTPYEITWQVDALFQYSFEFMGLRNPSTF